MLHKTRAVVLRQIKYSESSIIVQVFTELFGRQSYIVSGVRSKKSNSKINLFQTLHFVDMEVYNKPKRELQRIKEAKSLFQFNSIDIDPIKSTQAIFLAEVILKSIREEEKDPNLFEFLYNSVQLFDLLTKNYVNFHLIFLIHFTRFLGFSPEDNYNELNNYFDLRAGRFYDSPPLHNEYISEDQSYLFHELLSTSLNDSFSIAMSSKIRSKLLEHILDYYYLHISGMPKIKSHIVFTEMFSGL
ncbi:DNA repair protein RecO [Bacteroidota bacterium]